MTYFRSKKIVPCLKLNFLLLTWRRWRNNRDIGTERPIRHSPRSLWPEHWGVHNRRTKVGAGFVQSLLWNTSRAQLTFPSSSPVFDICHSLLLLLQRRRYFQTNKNLFLVSSTECTFTGSPFGIRQLAIIKIFWPLSVVRSKQKKIKKSLFSC